MILKSELKELLISMFMILLKIKKAPFGALISFSHGGGGDDLATNQFY